MAKCDGDCATLRIVSDVCLTAQAPVAEWLMRWSGRFQRFWGDSQTGAFCLLPLLLTDWKAIKI